MIRHAGATAFFLVLLAAQDTGGQGAGGDKPLLFETAYYPLKVGMEKTYQVGSRRVAVKVARAVTVEFKEGDAKVKVWGFVLESTSEAGTLSETVAVYKDDVYRVVSFGGKELSPPLCFLKRPRAGQRLKWQVESKRDNKILDGAFTVEEAQLAGYNKVLKCYTSDFKADGKPLKETLWFAEGVGLVKQQIEAGDHKVEMELTK